MAIKIQLNSLDSLERLIGGDTEIELSIRNNIVQEFTKKHLKALVNDDIIVKNVAKVKNDLEFQWLNEFYDKSKPNYYTEKFTLKDSVKKALKKELDDITEELVREMKDKIHEDVKKQLSEFANAIADRITNNYYEEMINSKVKIKLKEISENLNK